MGSEMCIRDSARPVCCTTSRKQRFAVQECHGRKAERLPLSDLSPDDIKGILLHSSSAALSQCPTPTSGREPPGRRSRRAAIARPCIRFDISSTDRISKYEFDYREQLPHQRPIQRLCLRRRGTLAIKPGPCKYRQKPGTVREASVSHSGTSFWTNTANPRLYWICLLYTSDAADE